MGNIKIKADISLQDCKTKEIFYLIKDGFYELLKRLNNEDISNKKRDKIVNFITEDFKKEQNEHIDILLNIGFINEEDINKNLNSALENGLITKEYYLKKQIEDLYKQGLINEECYNWVLKAQNEIL